MLLTPWGAGPEPADNEFMRRLFRRWDTETDKALSLQNLVVGFSQVKGTRDIMSNISYFFDLYDDDNDGKVDRDGILKMSEALLFIGRRGLDSDLASPLEAPRKDGEPEAITLTKDEQFLSAVSSFIRRCFEYADPDAALNVKAQNGSTDQEAAAAIDQFSIGDDEDDLLDLDDSKPSSPIRTRASRSNTLDSPKEVVKLPPVPSETKPNTHAANAALDPANPLFISLPTFRMVILADEILESFFDTGFPNTFHLADQPIPSTSSMANLTTFTSLGRSASSSSPAPGGGGVVPPGKGLRGMLDNIVNDGMRVATEVRRRMEDAQRELDKASAGAGAGAGAAKEEDEDD